MQTICISFSLNWSFLPVIGPNHTKLKYIEEPVIFYSKTSFKYQLAILIAMYLNIEITLIYVTELSRKEVNSKEMHELLARNYQLM